MLLDEVAAYLEEQGLGTTVGDSRTIWLSRRPPGPDNVVVLFETAAAPPEFTHSSVNDYVEQPRVQIQVRNTVETAAWTLADQVLQALIAVRNTVLSDGAQSAWYLWIRPVQTPFLLERDENDRAIVAFNVQVRKKRSTAI